MIRVMKAVIAGGVCALALGGAASAEVVELSMSTPIDGTTMASIHPYMAPGDIATLTVRYDTDVTGVPYGAATYYKNAITYFELSIERAGSVLYDGSISGAFGLIGVGDNTGASTVDVLTFQIFDANTDYTGGLRAGVNPAPDMPVYDTNDSWFGDAMLHDFSMHFTTVDANVLMSEMLPTVADLTMSGGGSPFAPHNGTQPWSGAWEFENGHSANPQTQSFGFGTFGPGTPRDSTPISLTTSVSAYTPGGALETPLPAALPLFGFGLAGLAGLRRKARKQGAR